MAPIYNFTNPSGKNLNADIEDNYMQMALKVEVEKELKLEAPTQQSDHCSDNSTKNSSNDMEEILTKPKKKRKTNTNLAIITESAGKEQVPPKLPKLKKSKSESKS